MKLLKIFKSEIFQLYFLYFFLVFVNYTLPGGISAGVYIVLLILILRSKRNYFWIALVFLIYSFSGGFFSYLTKAMYIGPFPYYVLFSLVLILKSLFLVGRSQIFYTVPLLLLTAYYIILRLMTGFNLEAIIKNAHFFLLFSMPLLLTSINDIRRFFKLSVATVLIALAGQIYLILTGTSLSYSIFGVSSNYQIVQEYDVEKFLRPTEG